MFNVAAAGEYDTETYLKVGLLLVNGTQLLSSWRWCVWPTNCLDPQSGLFSADALPAGNGNAAMHVPVCGDRHAFQRADRPPDQRIPKGVPYLCLVQTCFPSYRMGLTCMAAALFFLSSALAVNLLGVEIRVS